MTPTIAPGLCACCSTDLRDMPTKTIRGVEHTAGQCIRVQPRAVERGWECTSLPLWVRVWQYADYHHGVTLAPRQLRDALGAHLQAHAISAAITRAVRAGALRPGSTARALYSNTPRG